MDIALIGHDSAWDRRVPLTPAGAGQLVDAGHRVFVQAGVGAHCGAASVIIDLAMDQGGCVETSRPTTPEAPTFVKHGVIHVGLRHITALAGRTSSFAISHVLTHYVEELAHHGEQYREQVPDLWRGTYTFDGRVVNRAIEQRLRAA